MYFTDVCSLVWSLLTGVLKYANIAVNLDLFALCFCFDSVDVFGLMFCYGLFQVR